MGGHVQPSPFSVKEVATILRQTHTTGPHLQVFSVTLSNFGPTLGAIIAKIDITSVGVRRLHPVAFISRISRNVGGGRGPENGCRTVGDGWKQPRSSVGTMITCHRCTLVIGEVWSLAKSPVKLGHPCTLITGDAAGGRGEHALS